MFQIVHFKFSGSVRRELHFVRKLHITLIKSQLSKKVWLFHVSSYSSDVSFR